MYTLTDAGHRISHFTETVTENETLTLDRVVSYTYDANGNRLSKTSADQVGKRAVSLTMIWDARNRLRRVDQDGIAALHFDYDDLDRRIRKSGDSREADPILYVWDELAVLTELREGTGGNEPTTIASYALGLTRLALKRAGSGDQWFHHDMLGSIADLSDASGTVVEAKTFTPYGKQETISSNAEGGYNRYGYTGHEYDEETDLTYAKARFYDQDLGIFASADPVLGQFDRPPSLHRFIYGFSNPLSFYDPTGETADDVFEETLNSLAMEEESTWRNVKAFGVIMGSLIYKGVDMMSAGSINRISRHTDRYMAGDLSTGQFVFEVANQVAVTAAVMGANTLTGAGAAGLAARAGLSGLSAGIVTGMATGIGDTLIQDAVYMANDERDGLSGADEYILGALTGGILDGAMAAGAKGIKKIIQGGGKGAPHTPDAKTATASSHSPKSKASAEPNRGTDKPTVRERISDATNSATANQQSLAQKRAHQATTPVASGKPVSTSSNKGKPLSPTVERMKKEADAINKRKKLEEMEKHKSDPRRRLVVGAGHDHHGGAVRRHDDTLDKNEFTNPTYHADITDTIPHEKMGIYELVYFERIPHKVLTEPNTFKNVAKVTAPGSALEIHTGGNADIDAILDAMRANGFEPTSSGFNDGVRISGVRTH